MAQPLEVNITGGTVVETNRMSPEVKAQYEGLLASGDRLYDAGDRDGAIAKWKESDVVAEPYIRKPKKEEEEKGPPPTAANPAPPEFIPDTAEAIAICTSPDVCKSPSAPIPYMVWGKADDDSNYSPDVRSNGLKIKRADSRFTATYGDEPGTGLGVKSGTVGDVVEPTSWSGTVFANGIPVERHGDSCTLNNGNCPGEYVHVKSVQTDQAPDGNDEADKTRQQKIDEYAGSKGYRRAPDGGWYTDPNNTIGWVSDGKLGEEMDYVASGAGTVQPLSLGSGPSELKSYEPSWTERIKGSVQDGLMSLGMDKYGALKGGEKAADIAGFVPGLGSGLSGNEAYRSLQSGEYGMAAIHVVGALPLPGAAKVAEKLGVKAVEGAAAKGAERVAAREAETVAAREADDAAAAAARQADEAKQADRASKTGEDGARSTARKGKIPKVTRDKYGRIVRWDDTVGPEDIGTGTPTNQAARDHARSLGRSDDDAGHARGSLLGGSGTDKDNIFPQAPSVNRGQFRMFERNVADQISQTGMPARTSLIPSYDGMSTRPSSLTYQAILGDGRVVSKTFPNP